MNLNGIFKIDVISLEHLCNIAIAVDLWERPDVKEKIRNNFNGGITLEYKPDKTNNEEDEPGVTPGQQVVNYVFELLDMMNIPDHMLHSVKVLVVKLGQKISYWREYVTKVLNLGLDLAEIIYWTSYGQIDELKIVQFWLKNKKISSYGCYNCFLGNHFYCVASKYGQEDFINNHLEDMKDQILSYLIKLYRTQNWAPCTLISSWVFFCTHYKSKTRAVRQFRDFPLPLNDLPTLHAFWACMAIGNEFGVKYFWNGLNNNVDKKDLINQAAMVCLNLSYIPQEYRLESNNSHRTIFPFSKEVMIRLFIFFFEQMTEIEKTEFIIKRFVTVYKLFFRIWPYQELCEKFLVQLWDHISVHESNLVYVIFDNLLSRSRKSDYAPDYFTTEGFHKKIIEQYMKLISKPLKLEFLDWNKKFIIHASFKYFDNEILNLIINDDDLKEHKMKMISMGDEYFKEAMLKEDYKFLNKFIKNMKFTREELSSFKKNLNYLYKFLINRNDMTSAKEHLNWLSDSEDERNKLKSELDATEICFYLVQNNKFKYADEFLSWRFNSLEEREKVKGSLKSENFLVNKMLEFWGSENLSNDLCIEKSSELLNWHFGSEAKIAEFLETKLIKDELIIQKYWDGLHDVKTFERFESFLKFCSMTPEEIDVMKINIANNVNWWIETYALEKPQYFEMVQALLIWVYGDDKKERRKVIKNYMSSPRGSLLCLKIFKSSYKKSPSHILKFFNSWIKPSYNFEQLKMHLDGCDDSVFGEKIIPCIKSILEDRKKYKCPVSSYSLKGHVKYQTFCRQRHCYNYSCSHRRECEEEKRGEEVEKEKNYVSSDDDADDIEERKIW